MKYTTFNRVLWGLNSFDTFGYDKRSQTLIVKFFDGSEKHFTNICEQTVFEFIVSAKKEQFFKERIESQPATAKFKTFHQ
jgi:hypothetical protein